MSRDLGLVDWEYELAYLNSCQSFKWFVAIVADLVKDCVPCKQPAPGKTSLPWRTYPPGNLVKWCQKAWCNYKAAHHQIGRGSSGAAEALAAFSAAN